MTKQLLQAILSNISHTRPVFHSEADFQFELAWALKQNNSNLDIRLERPYYPKSGGKIEADIIIIDLINKQKIGMELKYVTKMADLNINGEIFNLKNHAAQNLRRYDFYKDISRLEILRHSKEINVGFSLFLTNDLTYLSSISGVGSAFDISNNHPITKNNYNWNGGWSNVLSKQKSVGASRMNPITISNQYNCVWNTFSSPLDINNQPIDFKYLLLEV